MLPTTNEPPKSRSNNALLREREPGLKAEVTSVELFFDLVFAIAVAQITHALLEHLTWLGALEALVLLLAVWWAWNATAWITNWLNPNDAIVRSMLFGLTGIGLVLSSSIPDAFGDRGQAFAFAYVVFQIGRTLFTIWAVRTDPLLTTIFRRILFWCIASGSFWVAGSFVGGETRLLLWLIAVTIDCTGPALGFRVPGLGTTASSEWHIDGGHMAERTGLFVMIAIGEALLSIGLTFTQLEWNVGVVLAMCAALAQSFAIWSIYFGEHAEHASKIISRADNPGALGRRAYTYVPIILVAGIVICAVGDELVLTHGSEHNDTAITLVLLGGPTIFLLGAFMFKLAIGEGWSRPRLLGLLALALTSIGAFAWPPLAITIVTTLIIVAVAIGEAVLLAMRGVPPDNLKQATV